MRENFALSLLVFFFDIKAPRIAKQVAKPSRGKRSADYKKSNLCITGPVSRESFEMMKGSSSVKQISVDQKSSKIYRSLHKLMTP